MSTVQVKGLAELKANFAKVNAQVSKKIIRRMAGAGAQVVKKAARSTSLIHDISGTLRRSVIVKFVREQSNETQAAFIVTYRKGKKFQAGQKAGKGKRKLSSDAFYASWVEFGHKIVRRAHQALFSRNQRAVNRITIRARRASATGQVPPHRFLGPTFAQQQAAALAKMESVARSEFDKLKV